MARVYAQAFAYSHSKRSRNLEFEWRHPIVHV